MRHLISCLALCTALAACANSVFAAPLLDGRVGDWRDLVAKAGKVAERGDPCEPNLPGACCFPDGSCAEIPYIACLSSGGYWQGSGIPCGSVFCQLIGACCYADGSCGEVSDYDCFVSGGNWQGAGTLCFQVSCPSTYGACCFVDGTCADSLPPEICQLIGGAYQGPGSACFPGLCAPAVGACCYMDGSCADGVTELDCFNANGAWNGPNSTCFPGLCPEPYGACCYNDGYCQDFSTESSCVGSTGVWQGANSFCYPGLCPPPPYGACCYAGGFCDHFVYEAGCLGSGGAWYGVGSVCLGDFNFNGIDDLCEGGGVTGACCFPDGSCGDNLDPNSCASLGGEWRGPGTICGLVSCGVLGACCYPDGYCLENPQTDCELFGGAWQGPGTFCAQVVCAITVGACCFPDGSCGDNLDPNSCFAGGGAYQGDGSICFTGLCTPTDGACCISFGCVAPFSPEECFLNNGVFVGAGIGCSPDPCVDLPGACCLPNGQCTEVPSVACDDFGGVFYGINVPCALVFCSTPEVGACCLAGGECAQLTPGDCAAQSGYFVGLGASCGGGFGGVRVSPGSGGVSLHRLDLTFELAPLPSSPYGLLYANSPELALQSGFAGYLNVFTGQGWVVRNLPVDPNMTPTGIGVIFDAGPYSGSSTIFASVVMSPDPQVCFFDPGFDPFDGFPWSWNAEGGEGLGGEGPRPLPPLFSVDLSTIVFVPLGETSGTFLGPNPPPNIEQDRNQCYPAAVANSLQWMENEYGIDVPHEHRPGIRDDSLVGELDKKMNRPAHENTPSAIAMVNGKLDYLNMNGLADEVHVKHKQRPPINWIAGDKTRGDATSHENTENTLSLLDWICREIAAGEDVELRIGWDGGGGHMVRVTGCGKILGMPWITYSHDANQGADPNAAGGVARNGGVSANDGGLGFSWVTDDKIRCFIGGRTSSASIDFAVSESPTYPPTKPTLAGQPSASTPRTKSRASQYTATRYAAGGGFKEDGLYKTLYDDPTWENANKTLKIDNVAVPTNVKEVHLNILFKTAQAAVPNITIVDSNGQGPLQTKTEWRDGMTNLLITWLLPDQPAWEKITFPDASYFNFTNIKRLGVATYCQRRPDANNNGVDDRIELAQNPGLDTNGNGILDEIDFADCNFNGQFDFFDILTGFALDCDENGRPDTCDVEAEPSADCNGNGLLDSCETVQFPGTDLNGNRIPDSCEGPAPCPGDMNCDGVRNFGDIDPFVLALQGQAAYEALFPSCRWLNGDTNNDGTVNFSDIDPFVALLASGPCP